MGIRFACPNGHPLHVKLDLAGKRGICPECQAKFIIPTPKPGLVAQRTAQGGATPQQSGAPRPAAAPSTVAAAPAASQSSATPAPAPQPSTGNPNAELPPAPPAPGTQPPAETAAPQQTSTATAVPVWYVRPATGGQFGPADDTLVRQWAADGRVGADAYVWRTGWPNWRLASEAKDYFPHLAPVTPQTPTLPSSPAEAAPTPTPAGQDPNQYTKTTETTPSSADVALTTARYQRRKQRAASGQMLAAVTLIVLALTLAGVLLAVLYYNGRPSAEETTPASETPVDRVEEPMAEPVMEAGAEAEPMAAPQ